MMGRRRAWPLRRRPDSVKPQIDGLGRLGGLVTEILVARAFGVKEVLHTHIYLPESASTSTHEIKIRSSGWPWWTHEVGVVGDLGVRLHLLHAAQLCAATTAPEQQSRLCRRGPACRATREGWRGEEGTMRRHGGREEAAAERGGDALRRRVPARKLAPP